MICRQVAHAPAEEPQHLLGSEVTCLIAHTLVTCDDGAMAPVPSSQGVAPALLPECGEGYQKKVKFPAGG